jgi:hypothetical protein
MQAFFYLLQRDADFENGFVGPVDKKRIDKGRVPKKSK